MPSVSSVPDDTTRLLLTGNDGDDPASVFVAIEEPHYVVRLTGGDGDDSGDISFTDYDVDVDAEVPGEADISVPPSGGADT